MVFVNMKVYGVYSKYCFLSRIWDDTMFIVEEKWFEEGSNEADKSLKDSYILAAASVMKLPGDKGIGYYWSVEDF